MQSYYCSTRGWQKHWELISNFKKRIQTDALLLIIIVALLGNLTISVGNISE